MEVNKTGFSFFRVKALITKLHKSNGKFYLWEQINSKNMRFFSFFMILIGLSFATKAQSIHHKLSMPMPQNHYFHLEVELTDFPGNELTMALPVWAPGSYLVREFSKNINQVTAKDEKGRSLTVTKTEKNKWKIEKGSAKKVVVSYEYYAFELSVRTSFLDDTHGFVTGNNLFMYPEGYLNLGGKLTVIPHASFSKITTALPRSADGVQTDGGVVFSFADYEQLEDCPIEIGNQEEFSFLANGIKHNVAMYGVGNYDIARLKVDMAKVVESTTAIFGENPNKEYWFIVHNSTVGSGGLEHTNSTVLNVNRWTYEGDGYLRFLSLVAHEYFHLWNVKRIRPAELWKYDYEKENYTDLLWVMEGFTSYYDELILRRAGLYNQREYLSKLKSNLNYVESAIGNQIQPVAHSSFDAWIKLYRPNENSSNTTISYYSKGHLIAAVFDAMIIKANNGKKSLDDLMQVLYFKYYKELKRGFTTEDLIKEMETLTKQKLGDFFRKYVYGTETIDYKKYLGDIGLKVSLREGQKVVFGASTSDDGGRLIVKRITAGSAAELAGLSVNDEIISFNGFRVNDGEFSKYLNGLEPGDEFALIISRDSHLRVLDCKMGTLPFKSYDFDLDESNKLGQYWLREQR
jgi:predicted metalloprotease with PDZ domain